MIQPPLLDQSHFNIWSYYKQHVLFWFLDPTLHELEEPEVWSDLKPQTRSVQGVIRGIGKWLMNKTSDGLYLWPCHSQDASDSCVQVTYLPYAGRWISLLWVDCAWPGSWCSVLNHPHRRRLPPLFFLRFPFKTYRLQNVWISLAVCKDFRGIKSHPHIFLTAASPYHEEMQIIHDSAIMECRKLRHWSMNSGLQDSRNRSQDRPPGEIFWCQKKCTSAWWWWSVTEGECLNKKRKGTFASCIILPGSGQARVDGEPHGALIRSDISMLQVRAERTHPGLKHPVAWARLHSGTVLRSDSGQQEEGISTNQIG